MGTTGIRGCFISSRNVSCATVVQRRLRIPGVSFFIDAVTDIAGVRDRPVITYFHRYVRIAPRLPSVEVVGQSPLSSVSHRCGGGHGTITPAVASGRRPPGPVDGRIETPRLRERVHTSTSRSVSPLMCERSSSKRSSPAPICMRGKPLDMETGPLSCADQSKCHHW